MKLLRNIKKSAGLIVLILAAAFIFFPKQFAETISKAFEGLGFGDSAKDNYEKQLSELESDAGVMASVTSKIRTYADTIHNALYGFGTKEEVVFDVFDKLRTPDEIKALYVAYGRRFTSSSWKNLGFGKYDLVQSLKVDLNEGEFNKVASKLQLGGFL